METVGTLSDVLRLHGVITIHQIRDKLAHLGQLTVMYLRTLLPSLQRIVLGCTHGVAHTVDNHLDGTRLTDNQQWLDIHAVVVVEQDLVHLHRVFREMELAVGDLHRVDILCCLGTIERNDEDTLALVLLSIHDAFDMAFAVVGLLTTVEQCCSCHSHET